MKKFEDHRVKFEHRREGQEAKYKRRMKAWFWKSVSDFIRHVTWYRKHDAAIAKKFGEEDNPEKDDFTRRIIYATIDRVTKSRAFAQNVGEEKGLIFLSSIGKKIGTGR